MINKTSLDTLCGGLAYAIGALPPSLAADANQDLIKYLDASFENEKADRIFMYNPDAIAQWIFEKYYSMFTPIIKPADLKLPFCTVMPSVTPVCFGTMYTGVQPEIHGIRGYVKPVITIETLFDSLIKSGKKAAIVSTGKDSMSLIFLNREMDYFIFDTIDEANQKAKELIISDEYDFIALYNGNYDSTMHKFGPESEEALSALEHNINAYNEIATLIEKHWKSHNTLVGFAMDHGCHEIDGNCGSHGLDMEEDLNIVHLYRAIKRN
jgi:predicted AlkP superfamily pyrophosphatase or phosphodiesterase